MDKMTDAEIREAAKKDFADQKKYDEAYDRKKGFIAGAKWAIQEILEENKNKTHGTNH
jgi:hypothetical protein